MAASLRALGFGRSGNIITTESEGNFHDFAIWRSACIYRSASLNCEMSLPVTVEVSALAALHCQRRYANHLFAV
jgi:hypothetical protein